MRTQIANPQSEIHNPQSYHIVSFLVSIRIPKSAIVSHRFFSGFIPHSAIPNPQLNHSAVIGPTALPVMN
jgi:hypothetical protein